MSGTPLAPTRTVHVRIEGRVQGVGFRAWVEATAIRLGLDGWVRNRRDGSVEALLSGPADKIEEILCAAERGPPAARVDRVEILAEGIAVDGGFTVRPTV